MEEFENIATLCAVVVAITLVGPGSGAALDMVVDVLRNWYTASPARA